MSDWLIEHGIGERRAVHIIDREIVAVRVERDSDGPLPGAILSARLIERTAGALALFRLGDGQELMGRALPQWTIGQTALVEVTRSSIPEAGLRKRPICRPASEDAINRAPPPLSQKVGGASDIPIHGNDILEEAGWSELLEQARSGIVPFDGGVLRIALTPAMTVIDVDGDQPAFPLALAAISAVARCIDRFDLAGNIVVDLPTVGSKTERNAIADRFDDTMTGPFERTAMNGYGLLQIIRPCTGPSLIHRVKFDAIESAALALLRRAERCVGHGTMTLSGNDHVLAWVEAKPDYLTCLSQRTGRPLHLQAQPSAAIWSFHAQ